MNAGVRMPGGSLLAVPALLLVTGCSPGSAGADRDPQDWVVVSYDVPRGDPALMSMLDTEREVQRALRRAGVGDIDGNEVGQGRYDLYLVGDDREAIWETVEPILADAPVAWSRVELRDGLDDRNPEVIRD